MAKNRKTLKLFLAALIAADLFVWSQIVWVKDSGSLELYFLDVGQGDSQLIIGDGIKILVDGGPANGKVLSRLGKILPAADRYLDLVVLTHPQLDHYGGLIEVLKNYKVGAFISNGTKGDTAAYNDLRRELGGHELPYVGLMEGSRIIHGDLALNFLSPSLQNLQSGEPNDTGLVFLLEKDGIRAVYTSDTGAAVEKHLVNKYDLRAHILKVGHHGSRFSSIPEFLQEIAPRISVIGVGKNSYGHPTQEVLGRLASVNSAIFRTDQDGTVKIEIKNGKLSVFAG